MDIDWSKAPEGYPVLLEDIRADREGSDRTCWAREGKGEYEFRGGGFWSYSMRDKQYIAHYRQEWTDEGLPPVGTVCEWHPNVHGWVEVTILGHDGDDTWYRVKGEDHTQTCRNMAFFRPIRTPEQIAAKERLKAIDEMAAIYKSNYEGHVKDGCQALYDAGYRKFEIVEGE